MEPHDGADNPTSAAPQGAMNRQRWSDPTYNGRTIHLVSDESRDEYVFRWPNSGHIGRYSREAMGGNAAKAARNLVIGLVLYPDKAELEARFDDKPGLPVALANEVNRKIGLLEEFSEKN